MPDGPGSSGPDYDEDFYAWTQYQAEVLRSMPCDDNRFDREHVAEEIEDLGKSERDAVRSQVRRILVHLLKLALFPGQRSAARMDEARSSTPAPSLRTGCRRRCGRISSASLPRLYRRARKRRELAICVDYGEQRSHRLLPTTCPYTLDQILEDDWYPEPPAQEET